MSSSLSAVLISSSCDESVSDQTLQKVNLGRKMLKVKKSVMEASFIAASDSE